MPIIETALLVKLGSAAAKIALKKAFLVKMAGLQAHLASVVGSQAAAVSTTLLATGCAVMYYEKKIAGNSDEQAINRAVANGVREEAAREMLRWLRSEGWL